MPPAAPNLYPSDGVNQIAFNNIRQNTITPTFRVSATHTESFNRFQLELNTASDFTGTAYTQTFSGTYGSGTQYNLLANGLSPSLPATDGVTYYVRVRASADGGSSWGQWSTINYPVWTFTYKSASGLPDWFQTTDAQFGTGTLTNVVTDSPNGRVKFSSAFPQVAGTNTGVETSNTDSHDVYLPSNIQQGDLLIILLALRDRGTWNLPSGWSQLYNVVGPGGGETQPSTRSPTAPRALP